jgi:hypothetical protein
MPNACVFCGADDQRLTDEHVWPVWMREDLLSAGMPAFGTNIRVANDEADSWSGRLLDVKVKVVCAACNNGWMSTLEAEVKPLMLDLMRCKATVLTPRRQALLARWAFKTAAMAQHANLRSPVIPLEHYIEFYEQQKPPADTMVFIACVEMPPDSGRVIDSKVATVTPRSFEHFDSYYLVTFRILNLAFQLVGVIGRRMPVGDLAFAARHDGIERLAPPTGRFTWPRGMFRQRGEADPLDEIHLRLINSAEREVPG